MPVTVSADEALDIDIGLAPQATELAELVVVGYGEQRQGNVTGALTNVTSEEFNKGRIVTPTELIQNKVAGVQVVENTEPGGKTSIRIRGGTSTTASNEPLYVIDGQPLTAGAGATSGRDPLNFLNPDDIASMTVLRDAGAAAIYGTNAANGVVLITTKRGRAGQPMKVEYTGSVSASTITRIPSMLNAEQFRTAVEQFAPVAADSQLLNANTDWFDAIDRTGFGQEHNVALSGGGTTNDYRVSFNFLDQHGIIDANSAQRIGLGLNFNQRLAGDRLNLRFSLRGSRTEDHFTPLGVLSNAAQYGPTQPIEDPGSPTGFYEWAPPTTARPRPTIRWRSLIWPRKRPRRIAPSATCRPSTGCRGWRGSRPTSILASTRATASGGTSRRACSTGSRRPAEAVNRPGTIRSRPARCSRPISTTPRRARSVRASST